MNEKEKEELQRLRETNATAVKTVEKNSRLRHECAELSNQLDNVESLYKKHYGDPVRLHLALVGIFGVIDSDD